MDGPEIHYGHHAPSRIKKILIPQSRLTADYRIVVQPGLSGLVHSALHREYFL
jgi:hypothetical protein